MLPEHQTLSNVNSPEELFPVLTEMLNNPLLDSTIAEVLAYRISRFFPIVASRYKNAGEVFVQNGGFELFDRICTPNVWHDVFLRFVKCGQNIAILVGVFFSKICLKSKEKQERVFRIVRESKNLDELDRGFPIERFFNQFKQPIEDLVVLFCEVYRNAPAIIGRIMGLLFVEISEKLIDEP
jgi:hypothetical protein